MTWEQLERLAKDCGFTNWAKLDVTTLELKQEVRDMCEANTCGKYGACWSCPPHCGDLAQCAEDLGGMTQGILVQVVGDVEDGFDIEAMMELNEAYKDCFSQMYQILRASGERVLALGAGCCTRCRKCTCPDEPCRFPQERISSMEAYGLLVLEVCKRNGLTYYYGQDKLAYTGCFLLG